MPYNKQRISRHLDREWLTDETLVDILPKTPEDSSVEILAPVNLNDSSIEHVLEIAALYLSQPQTEHVMFPLGPDHWYLVKISKGAVEVFDPYNHDVSTIFNSLRPHLNFAGIHDYQEIHGKFQVPQYDGYACGYFVAAKAHELLRDLEPKAQASCNHNIISTLNTCGNQADRLRDAFITAYAKEQELAPVKIQKSNTSSMPDGKDLFHSYFKMKDNIHKIAQEIKAKQSDTSTLTDEELAYLQQDEEFSKLKR